MDINLKLHNLIFTIGPSGCGKTHFVKNELIPKLREVDPTFKVQYISSDDIRRDLLDLPDMDKMDDRMLYPSDLAFKLLHTKIDAYMGFPVNSEFIIVDTTGLSEPFYKKLIKQAQEHNYAITPFIFQYKTREEYMRHSANNSVTSRHVDKLNKRVMPNITQRMFTDIIRVKKLEEGIDNLKITKHDLYKKCQLTNESNQNIIIGDVHGCYDQLIELLAKNNIEVKDNRIQDTDKTIVLVGDYIDKNTDENIRKTVEFVYDNREHFKIVYANHENYVYKRLKNKFEGAGEEVEKEHFSSVFLFQKDEELRDKFIELVEMSVPFLRHDHFFVTHAPCENKYMGKLDRASMKAQRDLKYARLDNFESEEKFIEARNKDLSFLMSERDGGEAVFNHPFKIFGHVKTKNVYCKDNILAIDQGCCAGGRLTSVTINGYKSKFFQGVYNDNVPKGKLYNLIVDVDKWWEFDYSECERKEASRIRFGARNKVNFISGTLSPSDKKDGQLETIETAIEYYQEKNVGGIILQPKYMGSRCQLYLFKDDDECYGVTRNGYRIDKEHLDLGELFPKVKEIPYIKDFFENRNGKLMIVDGELMPWRVLGKGLIDVLFKGVGAAVRSEQNKLEGLGFYDITSSYIENEYTDADYENIHHELSKKQLDKTLGGYRIRKTMEAVKRLKGWDMSHDKELSNLKLYDEQVKLFGSEDKLHFKPFAVLKTVFEGGTEEIFDGLTNYEQFNKLSEDNYLICDFNTNVAYDRNGKLDVDVQGAIESFYKTITKDEKMEGVVVKPERFEDDIAPMIKVRNPNYLTLVYGYDYQKPYKHDKLYRRKGIRNKMKLSIEEFQTGMDILNIPYDDIAEDNKKYGFFFNKFIEEESREVGLDPRL